MVSKKFEYFLNSPASDIFKAHIFDTEMTPILSEA